jgi:hypothetical protein
MRNDLNAVRVDISGVASRVDVLAGQMAVAQSALTRHGRALDVLLQDVRECAPSSSRCAPSSRSFGTS